MNKLVLILSSLINPSNFMAYARWAALIALVVLIASVVIALKNQANPSPTKWSKARFWMLQLVALLTLAVAGYTIMFNPPQVLYPQGPLDTPLVLNPQHPLTISFDRPVSQVISAKILPPIEGQWRLEAKNYGPLLKNQYTFYPKSPVISDIEYTVSIENILPAAWIHLNKQAQPYLFVFRPQSDQSTAPSTEISQQILTVVSTDPVASASNVLTDQAISVTFNQPIVANNIDKSIRTSPEFSLKAVNHEQSIVLTPVSNLSYDTRYQITLLPTLTTPLGNSLENPFSFSFTTVPYQFRLSVPLHKQHYKFTCFSAAAKMVLSYYDIEIDEVGFLDEIGFDSTKRNYLTNTWGDPTQGIVGTYNGSGDGGYGAHWQPVTQAIANHRKTEILQNASLAQILSKVKEGYPVMVWWVNGVWPAKELHWKNTNGEIVRAVNGMHVEIVTGWIGNQQNPEYILTNDPWRGYRQYTPEGFQALWQWFNNTAVVVY